MNDVNENTGVSYRLKEFTDGLVVLTDEVVAARDGAKVKPDDVSSLIISAARLFTALTDSKGKQSIEIEQNSLNATETVVLVTALLESADINLFDLALWYRRPE